MEVSHAESALAAQAFRDGQAAWPGIGLSAQDFGNHIGASRVAPEALQHFGPDLFLSAACAAGDARALAYLDSRFLSAVPRYTARLALSADQAQEVTQRLRIRLLTGERPRIATYAGRAPLGAWIRMAAIRLALDEVAAAPAGGAEKRAVEALDGLLDSIVRMGPEQLVARENLRVRFQAALERSIGGLSPRDAAIVRMSFVDGLNIDAIGRVFRVHRTTVARWLAVLRRRVFDEIRSDLGLDVRPTTSEFRSMVNLVEPALHLSLDRLLP